MFDSLPQIWSVLRINNYIGLILLSTISTYLYSEFLIIEKLNIPSSLFEINFITLFIILVWEIIMFIIIFSYLTIYKRINWEKFKIIKYPLIIIYLALYFALLWLVLYVLKIPSIIYFTGHLFYIFIVLVTQGIFKKGLFSNIFIVLLLIVLIISSQYLYNRINRGILRHDINYKAVVKNDKQDIYCNEVKFINSDKIICISEKLEEENKKKTFYKIDLSENIVEFSRY